MKEKIHVVFSPDENYAVLAGVAIFSILHHASDPGRFHFYFLQGNQKLSDRSRAKFSEVIKPYGAALDYVEVDVGLLAGFENHGPKTSYLRSILLHDDPQSAPEFGTMPLSGL